MREINYRAWDKKKQMWTNWKCYYNMFYFMDKNTGVWIRDDEFERFILMQYTGLKDIRDKKVFEGDIIKIKETIYTDCGKEEVEEIREFTGMVVWFQNGWHIAKKVKNHVRYHSLWLWNIKDDSMEIIGNIYDNPELLK